LDLRDIATDIFMAIAKDVELLTLLGVPSPYSITDVRKQIYEDVHPSDLVTTTTKLCIFELPSLRIGSIENCEVEIDIYCTKDKDLTDRRILKIAQRLIDLLDDKTRNLNGISSVEAGTGLRYARKISNMTVDGDIWKKFGLIFEYDYVRI